VGPVRLIFGAAPGSQQTLNQVTGTSQSHMVFWSTMRTRSWGICAVAIASGLLLAACGGGSSSGSTATTSATTVPDGSSTTNAGGPATTGSGATSAATQAYVQCLKDNGVTLPAGGFARGGGGNGGGNGGGGTGSPPAGDGSTDSGPPDSNGGSRTPRSLPGGVDQATFQKAMAACASLRPAGAAGGFGGGGGAGRLNGADSAAYRQCMQDNGVTLPAGPPSTVAGAAAPTTSATPPTRLDRNSDVFKAANAKCAVLLPAASTTTTTVAKG
jgi:hypothetical protein